MVKALIIEDEVDLCKLLSLHLVTLGIQNDYTHSVQDAKSLIGSNYYDLLFLDMNLTDGNGFEILSQIKIDGKEPKVIVVSGCDSARERALNEGALFFLAKPFTRQNIEHVVRILLNGK